MTRIWCRPRAWSRCCGWPRPPACYDLLDEYLSVDSPAATVKTACVVAGMLAGADSIDDLDLLRHGGMGKLFRGIRAPSTLGTYLRWFTHGHVQQFDAVNSRLIAGPGHPVPGWPDRARWSLRGLVLLVDVDDTIGEVHGHAKQGAAYGYSRGKGLNMQLATISTPGSAPVIARPGCAGATSPRHRRGPAGGPSGDHPDEPASPGRSWPGPTPPTTGGRSSMPRSRPTPGSRSRPG